MGVPQSLEQSAPPECWVEKIFDDMGAQLFGYLRTLLRDVHCAEDVMQNVFVKLLRTAHQKSEIQNLRAFVFTIAHNEAMRELGKKQPKSCPPEDRIFEVPEDAHLSVVDALCLEEALLSLPYEQREVTYLKLYGEFTFEEIGKTLGISLNTAASRYRYALGKMRDFLGEQL